MRTTTIGCASQKAAIHHIAAISHASSKRCPPTWITIDAHSTLSGCWGDNQSDVAVAYTALHEVMALIEWWVRVTGCAEHLPQQTGKSLPVQAHKVHVTLRIHHHQVFHLSNKDRRSAESQTDVIGWFRTLWKNEHS